MNLSELFKMFNYLNHNGLYPNKNASLGILRRVAVARTDVSKKRTSSIIRMKRIGELGTTLTVTSKTSLHTRPTEPNIPEGVILHSHHRENLKSYIALTG
jgi:hypothetical protein